MNDCGYIWQGGRGSSYLPVGLTLCLPFAAKTGTSRPSFVSCRLIPKYYRSQSHSRFESPYVCRDESIIVPALGQEPTSYLYSFTWKEIQPFRVSVGRRVSQIPSILPGNKKTLLCVWCINDNSSPEDKLPRFVMQKSRRLFPRGSNVCPESTSRFQSSFVKRCSS